MFSESLKPVGVPAFLGHAETMTKDPKDLLGEEHVLGLYPRGQSSTSPCHGELPRWDIWQKEKKERVNRVNRVNEKENPWNWPRNCFYMNLCAPIATVATLVWVLHNCHTSRATRLTCSESFCGFPPPVLRTWNWLTKTAWWTALEVLEVKMTGGPAVCLNGFEVRHSHSSLGSGCHNTTIYKPPIPALLSELRDWTVSAIIYPC